MDKQSDGLKDKSTPEMNFVEKSLFGVPFKKIHTILLGLALVILLALFSMWLSNFIGITLLGFTKSPISSVMICLILGMVINNVIKLPKAFEPGFKFSVKKLLRFGIIMLGIRLSLSDVFKLGLIGIPLVVACITSALLITSYLNKKLNQPKRLGTLIAVGTAICGVSAIVATSPTIDAKEEETAYAVAVITVFGLIATMFYPFLAFYLFGGNPVEAGLWLGTSIHDTSQVTGSALIFADFWNLPQALDVATVTKLVRNVFMILVIPLMAFIYTRNKQRAAEELQSTNEVIKPKINYFKLFPLFIIGFLLMSVFRTLGDIGIDLNNLAYGFISPEVWNDLIKVIKDVANFLFIVALGGVGLTTKFSKFRGLGTKPFLVGLFAALTIGIISFLMITLMGGFITIS